MMKARTDKKKQIMAIMMDVITASKNVEKCQKASCKKEYSAAQVKKKVHVEEVNKLFGQFQRKEITFDEFKKQTKAVADAIIDSDETKHLAECSLQSCKTKIMVLFKAFIQTYQYDCKVEKKKDACAKLKTALDMLNTKPFTVNEYIQLLKIVSKING